MNIKTCIACGKKEATEEKLTMENYYGAFACTDCSGPGMSDAEWIEMEILDVLNTASSKNALNGKNHLDLPQ